MEPLGTYRTSTPKLLKPEAVPKKTTLETKKPNTPKQPTNPKTRAHTPKPELPENPLHSHP